MSILEVVAPVAAAFRINPDTLPVTKTTVTVSGDRTGLLGTVVNRPGSGGRYLVIAAVHDADYRRDRTKLTVVPEADLLAYAESVAS